jgi:hypothetical protein
MKKAIEQKVSELAETLSRIRNLAKMLPQSGPVPNFITPIAGGELFFSANFEPSIIKAVGSAFGPTDWKRHKRTYSSAVDFVKKLENGVTIRIEYAERPPLNGVEVDAATFAK